MNTCGLGNIVTCLFLGEVGDVARHGSGADKGSSLALLEVSTNGLGAVSDTVEIGLDDFFPGLDGAVKDTGVGSLSSVGDESVNLAEILDDLVDETLDRLVAGDVHLVGLALDAVLLAESLCVLDTALGARGIGDGDVGAHLGGAASGLNAHSSWAGRTSDDDNLALHGEHVHEALGLCDLDRHVCGSFLCIFLDRLRSVGCDGVQDENYEATEKN